MVLVFPGKDSITFNEYIERFSEQQSCPEEEENADKGTEVVELNENGCFHSQIFIYQ